MPPKNLVKHLERDQQTFNVHETYYPVLKRT